MSFSKDHNTIRNPLVSTIYHPDTHLTQEEAPERLVGCRTVLLIASINDLEQTLKVDMSAYLHWQVSGDPFPSPSESSPTSQSSSEKKQHKKPKRLTNKPDWVPSINFYNYTEITVIAEDYFQMDDTIYAFYNWIITIWEPFELECFPFDRQILKVMMTTNNCAFMEYNEAVGYCFVDCPRYDPDDNSEEPCNGNNLVLYELSAWELDDFKIYTYYSRDEDEDELVENVKTTRTIELRAYMTRQPEFYIYNVVLTTFLIVMCNMSVVTIPIEDFTDRMSITMTLLLTMVAFKFVLVNWVPVVPYLTYLDKYNLFSILMLMVVTLENFIVAYDTRIDYEDKDHLDRWFFGLLFILWVTIHILIYFGSDSKRLWFTKTWKQVKDEDNAKPQSKVKNSLFEDKDDDDDTENDGNDSQGGGNNDDFKNRP